MDLRSTPARFLDKFIELYLLPNTHFRMQVKQAIHIICEFLKERCFRSGPYRVRILKVVKGGSSGKGTALRGRSDADLVVFLSPFDSFQDQLHLRKEYIEEIRRQLEACQREKLFSVEFKVQNPLWNNPRALSFVLSSSQLKEEVEFDVLPAFDALGQLTTGYKPDPKVYVELIQECTRLKKEGEFSTCFTELQRDFLRQRPTKLKSLIRLVKHWFQICKEKIGKPLPQQYALELLTVYAWEKWNGETEFETAQGFQTVLELVINYKELCIYWTVNYDFSNSEIKEYLKKQLEKSRPVILDPADPTGNVGGGDPEGWRRLAREAEAWLGTQCFIKWDGSPVGSWITSGRTSFHRTHLLLKDESDSEDQETWANEAYPRQGYVGTYQYPDFSQHYSTSQAVPTPQTEENWTCAIL
ncbi:2'-5'-oligoadenylate synthase 1 isoform X1 [Carlito syrichta]|uniref:2'-5' oligoadenylate synthase n=1 Tax=Carlito syrichta TaxID=1868482 RepID=A0A1U7TU37_CARSF|nr:2'-5'-oligoadenylate synthase 1 isoform X1 [Carlito syrichta]